MNWGIVMTTEIKGMVDELDKHGEKIGTGV
jgi:hypothetical protein